jgi:hypothetical protein
MKYLVTLSLSIALLFFVSTAVVAQSQPRSQVDRDGVALSLQVNGTKVIVQNVIPRSTIQIFNVLGVKLKEFKTPANGDNLQFDLPKGCYILKTDNVVRKIAIK